MCFSQRASGAFALLGWGSSYYFYRINEPPIYYMYLVFYSGMEFLQFLQYFFIDDCDNFMNKFLTYMAYIYIWIQPYFINRVFLASSKKHRDVFIYNIWLSVLIFLLALDRIVLNFLHPYPIRMDEIMCGQQICTINGPKHLIWHFKMMTNGGLEVNSLFYVLLIGFPLFWLDHYSQMIYFITTFFSGLFASYWYTGTLTESVPFWCFLSIPFLISSHTMSFLKRFHLISS